MLNLFDGQGGNSDGTANGPSAEFEGTGPFNVFVFGTFDSAEVFLQRYSQEQATWYDTDLKWTDVAQYQGLQLTVHSKYRLNIINAGASTSIIAERA